MSLSSALVAGKSRVGQRRTSSCALGDAGRKRTNARAAAALLEVLETRMLLAGIQYISTDVPKTIADLTTITSDIVVTDLPGATLADVDVSVDITHTFDGDLTITLISPMGTRVTLAQWVGGGGTNFTNTMFDDQASVPIAMGVAPFNGSFIPTQALAILNSEPADGTWQLEVSDSYAGDQGVLNGWSVILTPEGTGEPIQIAGHAWNDVNGNGVRDTSLSPGSRPDIVLVMDVSALSMDPLSGTPVGDLNNDGTADTILDAEIAGFTQFNRNLITRGLGDETNIAIVVFADTAQNLDMNPASGNVMLSTTASADLNSNGTPDVEELLAGVMQGQGGVGTASNYEAALQQVITTFTGLTDGSTNRNMVFLAADWPSAGGGYYDEAATLRSMGVCTRAFGAGVGPSYYDLRVLYAGAQVFTQTDDLLNMLGGGAELNDYIEKGMADWRMFLDLNENGTWDSFEPTSLTDATGYYSFSKLRAGTYTLREVPRGDWETSFPAEGYYSLTIQDGGATLERDFGNFELGRIVGSAYSDVNKNGYRDTNLALGTRPDILLALDISSNSVNAFPDANVGDINQDGFANTVLDVELAAAIALNQNLIDRGMAGTARLGVLAYADTAYFLDLVPPGQDQFIAIRPSADLETILRGFVPDRRASTVGADLEGALQHLLGGFTALGTPAGNRNIAMLSHAGQNIGGSLDEEVAALDAAGVNRHAFGAGPTASAALLQQVDSSAMVYTDSQVLIRAFGGQPEGSSLSYVEAGVPNAEVYLDSNGNGALDAGEPTMLTGADGSYVFSHLDFGDYTVRQTPIPGWMMTQPADGARNVTISPGVAAPGQHFGNVQLSSIAGIVFRDNDRDGVLGPGDVVLPNATVYLDANDDLTLNPGEVSTTTDANGAYLFSNLVPGAYIVRHVTPAGLVSASPQDGAYYDTPAPGAALVGRDFADKVPLPGMGVYGAGRSIVDGSSTPSIYNLTDFKKVGLEQNARVYSFSIRNPGDGALLLDGQPRVAITGKARKEFRVVAQPARNVNPFSSTKFSISFKPTILGQRNAWVSITSTAPGHRTYSFKITGKGIEGNTTRSALAEISAPVSGARIGLDRSEGLFNPRKRIIGIFDEN